MNRCMTISGDKDTDKDVTIDTTTNKWQRQSVCALCEELNDKRDYFTFPIVKFLFISNNIPASTSYGVYISQAMCYSRVCAQYSDFLDKAQLLPLKVHTQCYVVHRLRSSEQKFHYKFHHDLVDEHVYYFPGETYVNQSWPILRYSIPTNYSTLMINFVLSHQ